MTLQRLPSLLSSDHVYSLSCLLLQVQFECSCCTGHFAIQSETLQDCHCHGSHHWYYIFHGQYCCVVPRSFRYYCNHCHFCHFHPTNCDLDFLNVYKKDACLVQRILFKWITKTECCANLPVPVDSYIITICKLIMYMSGYIAAAVFHVQL